MPSLKEFVHQNTIQLDKRKQKIKHLIDTLNGLTLDHCTIPLPLTILNKVIIIIMKLIFIFAKLKLFHAIFDSILWE